MTEKKTLRPDVEGEAPSYPTVGPGASDSELISLLDEPPLSGVANPPSRSPRAPTKKALRWAKVLLALVVLGGAGCAVWCLLF